MKLSRRDFMSLFGSTAISSALFYLVGKVPKPVNASEQTDPEKAAILRPPTAIASDLYYLVGSANEEEFLSVSERLGEYNYYEDNITIYINKIQYLTKKYKLNIEKMINYSICHEYGHAKQARIFEEQQYFPNLIGKYRKRVYDLEGRKIFPKDLHQFITNLLDFCINKEL